MFANLLKVINDNGSTFLNVSPWRKMRARHDYSKFNHIISRQVKHIWIIETNILWWSFRKLGLTCWLRLMLLIECGTVENSREWWIARRAVSMLVCVCACVITNQVRFETLLASNFPRKLFDIVCTFLSAPSTDPYPQFPIFTIACWKFISVYSFTLNSGTQNATMKEVYRSHLNWQASMKK